MEHLGKSVYRFMAKMKNLTFVEEEILKFLRRSSYMAKDKMRLEVNHFLQRIKGHEKNRFQTRVFVYLDIISWAESKVYNKPVQKIIEEKYQNEVHELEKKRA
jgi:hypothetical protein